MDTPTPSPTGTPSFTQQKKTVLIICAVLLVALLGYGAYKFWNGGGSFGAGTFVVASDNLPLAPARLLNLDKDTLEMVLVEDAGESVVYDIVNTDTRHYSILGDATRSNVYRRGEGEADFGLEELTHSDSLKFDLSVDATSGIVAYTAQQGDTTHVFVWSPLTKEETDLGVGLRPTVLPGGFFVVFEQEGKLVSARLETKTTAELLTLPSEAPFVIDTENLEAVLYNPIRSALERYSLVGMVTASFIAATPVEAVPLELAYDGGVIQVLADETAHTASVMRGGRPMQSAALFEPLLAGSYKLTVYHD